MSDVSLGDALVLLEAGAFLLDVREPEEWFAGHAPEAVFIPMGALATRLDELPTDRPVVVMCRSGHRSGMVTEALRGAGFAAVNLSGGILAWESQQRPLVSEMGTPGVVL